MNSDHLGSERVAFRNVVRTSLLFYGSLGFDIVGCADNTVSRYDCVYNMSTYPFVQRYDRSMYIYDGFICFIGQKYDYR